MDFIFLKKLLPSLLERPKSDNDSALQIRLYLLVLLAPTVSIGLLEIPTISDTYSSAFSLNGFGVIAFNPMEQNISPNLIFVIALPGLEASKHGFIHSLLGRQNNGNIKGTFCDNSTNPNMSVRSEFFFQY